MAVATKFSNWSNRTPGAPFDRPSPNLTSLLEYLEDRWGGHSLGIYGVRKIRGGSAWSTHAFGAALDWRWQAYSGAPSGVEFVSSNTMADEVIPFLVDNSAELGIQAIHVGNIVDPDPQDADQNDGVRAGSWRADRPGTANDGVWLEWSTGYGGWIHIEVHPDAWSDGRPVEEKLGAQAPAPTPAQPAEHDWVTKAYTNPKPVLRVGSQGVWVRWIQEIMRSYGMPIAVDGKFGTQTKAGVEDVQKFWGLAVDGVVGNQQTWPIFNLLAVLKVS